MDTDRVEQRPGGTSDDPHRPPNTEPVNKFRRTDSPAPLDPAREASTSRSILDAPAPAAEAPAQALPHLDIVNYPSADLLRMLAMLLQHIASSNDQLRGPGKAAEDSSSWTGTPPRALYASMYLPLDNPRRPTTTSAAFSVLNAPSSTLCFHARNIPSISIEAYLLRILKYCPTTNDVFLSLLVYFDRMSRVGVIGNFPGEPPMGPRVSRSTDDVLPLGPSPGCAAHAATEANGEFAFPGMRGFAIDSYNVHRLIIAGITVASKFFSDVFYTNSRYAKVGGLAVHELNQLELHFLLLNDFRLMIPMSEIQQYADQLLAYASERGALPIRVPRSLGAAEEHAAHCT